MIRHAPPTTLQGESPLQFTQQITSVINNLYLVNFWGGKKQWAGLISGPE